MFKRLGLWLRRIDGWFFRLTDKERVGVVLGTALFLFSSALYCLGIGSVVLLQRPYEVRAEVVTVLPETETAEIVGLEEIPELVSTPTPLPTPTTPAGSPLPTPIAAVEIDEPPAVPRPVIAEPPARPRVVGPDIKPEAPSQRIPTAVPPTRAPVIAQPTSAPKPNGGGTVAPTSQPTSASKPQVAPQQPTAASKPTLMPTPNTQPTAAIKVITAIPTVVPKPAQSTPVSKPQVAPTTTNR